MVDAFEQMLPDNLDEVIKRWDANQTLWSIEMGGMGPGYEQAIQIGIFELLREIKDLELPKAEPNGSEDDNKKLNNFMDEQLRKVMLRVKALDGLSGAMAGAIMSAAYKFKRYGYKEQIIKIREKHNDRLIQVDKKFPAVD